MTRSFLDYRIPVYEEINLLCGNQLTVIFYAEVVPKRCRDKLKAILGERAVGLTGEIRIGGRKIENQAFANSRGFRISIRPGLVNYVRKTNPDLIISDGFFQWTYAALANNSIWRTPHLMCYERTLHTERNASFLRTFARKAATNYISGICCNGMQTKQYLMHLGFPENWLFSGNMAPDCKDLQKGVSLLEEKDLSDLRNKYDIKGQVYLYAGQLIPRKGIIELLTAWKKFSEKNHAPCLLLIGGGEEEKKTIDLIQSEKIERVKIIGNVDYSDMAKYYALADIFIIATLEDNWSLVVPEAMSCSLPIICSKYNGCWPELVTNENGWVFDPLDLGDFVDTLHETWEKRGNWKEMGQQSLKIVQDFSPEKIAQNIYSACQKVIGVMN